MRRPRGQRISPADVGSAPRRRALVVSALLLTAAGCAGGVDRGGTPSGAAASAGSTAAPSVATATAPTALPSAGDLQSGCADALDDGRGHDLAGVWLVRQGDMLVVAVTLVAPPVSGSAFLTVELRTSDGRAARQLGIELDGDRPVTAYVATSPTAPAQRLEGAVHVQGAEVHAVFPADVLDDLGPAWGWVASVSSASAMEDTCPGEGRPGPVPPVVP